MDSQLLARYLSEFDLPKNVGATTDAAAPGPNLDFLRALQLLGAALRCRSRIRTETLSQFEAKVFPPQEALEGCDVLIHAVPVQSSREAAV